MLWLSGTKRASPFRKVLNKKTSVHKKFEASLVAKFFTKFVYILNFEALKIFQPDPNKAIAYP